MSKLGLYYFDVEVDFTYDYVFDLFKHQTVFMKYTKKPTGYNTVRIQPEPMTDIELKTLQKALSGVGATYKQFKYEDPKKAKL